MPVESLAAQMNLSPRQFARFFVAEFGITPARFVEKLRLETAQRLLKESDYPLKQVATRYGFASAEIMRRTFLRNIGISPIAYQNRFSLKRFPLKPLIYPFHRYYRKSLEIKGLSALG
jgi:transcriptional regulator GlxA family with amidase domain